MKSAIHGARAAAAATALLAAAGCSIVRDRDGAFEVLDAPMAVCWEPTDPIPAGAGILVQPLAFTNGEIEVEPEPRQESSERYFHILSFDGPRGDVETDRIRFPPGPFRTLPDQPLMRREVRDIWGNPVLRWRCLLESTWSEDGRYYDLSIIAGGEGTGTYTVLLDWTYEPRPGVLAVTAKEQFGSGDARKARFRFQLSRTGEVQGLEGKALPPPASGATPSKRPSMAFARE